MYETVRIIYRLRPKFVLWENVKNAKTGEKHKKNYEKYLKTMEKFGYTNYDQILVASDYGIPQKRERIFVLSIFDGTSFEFPPKQILTTTYRDYLVENYDPKKVVLSSKNLKLLPEFGKKANGEKKHGGAGHIIKKDIYNTITAKYGKISGYSGKIPCKEGYRILTPLECWRLMGFDDEDFRKASIVNKEKDLYKQAGNAIVVNVLEEILKEVFHMKEYKERIYKQHLVTDYVMAAFLSSKEKDEEGNASVEIFTPNCALFLTIKNYNQFEGVLSNKIFSKGLVNHSTIRILEIILLEVSERKFISSIEVDIGVEKIMNLLGKSNSKRYQEQKDDIKKQIKIALNIFRNTTIRCKQPNGEFETIGICSNATALKDNMVHFEFDKKFYDLLKYTGIDIYMPLEILQFNEKYKPYTYLLYKKLLSALETGNEAILKIRDIYDYCVTLPRIEKVKKENRDLTPKIRNHMEKALNSINEFEWEYENKNLANFWEWLDTRIIIRRKNNQTNEAKIA